MVEYFLLLIYTFSPTNSSDSIRQLVGYAEFIPPQKNNQFATFSILFRKLANLPRSQWW